MLGLVGRDKARRSDGAVCGRCGYSVKGLESFNCPECGADLREVGIHRPGGVAGKNVMLILGMVLLVSTMLCCGGGLFFTAVQRSSNIQTAQPAPLGPPSQPLTPATP